MMSLTNRILLAMVTGILLGSSMEWLLATLDPESTAHRWILGGLVNGVFDVVGRIFVASLKLLVVPLVLVSLICGMTSLGNSSRMGSIAGKTIFLYLLTTGVAVTLGLAVASFVGPGIGVDAPGDASFTPKAAPPLTDTLVNIFPTNPFSAMAEGKMLQVIVFALLVGFALTRAGEAGERIAAWFRDMEVVVMKMVGILIELAPWGCVRAADQAICHDGDFCGGRSCRLLPHTAGRVAVPRACGLCAVIACFDRAQPRHASPQDAPRLGFCLQYIVFGCHAAYHAAHSGDASRRE
jgi:Na+/H+-dicarboxylate symporter